MRHTLALPLLALAIAFPAATATGQSQDPLRSGPQTKEEQVDQKPKKKRDAIYDEAADAKQQIAAALVKAKKENRRVLIQWGANWCGWCYLLHDLCKSDRQLQRELRYEYDVVLVDIGRWDKNVDLAEHYGVDFKKHGVPYLTVLDADGSVLVNRETGSLEDGSKHDPAKVLAFLRENKAPYLSADSVLSEGLAQANETGKRVFLHFGAPWCGWCHRLEDWMAREDVARILGKDFVDVKIDTDRTIGGQDLMKHYTKGQPNGIPWYAVVDPNGEVLVTSNYPTNNIGFPYQPEEIEAFGQMLAEGSIRLTDKDIAALKESLAEARQEIERRRAERRRSDPR